MQFNTPEYLVFFLAVLGVSWLTVGVPRLRIWILFLASYYFYVSNNHWLLVLIVVSTNVDYFCGLALDRTDDPMRRKMWLWTSVAVNLGILGFFKYFNFFAESMVDFAGLFGAEPSWVDLNIVLPVGISFYTFQSMSYTIDLYHRRIPAERSWYRFSFFVAFFPQLVAGPIVRAREFLPQVPKRPELSAPDFEEALYRIFRGLFKKVVLADFVAIYADQAFGTPGDVDWLAAWVGVYAFALQIYFDFSGYTDIAIGCSRLMGFRIPENFRRPYMATSITDFWRRWHMTLSRWLRDYVYISLGGNRMKSALGVHRNLMATMLLGGLWHGAAWNFVIWGGLHGALLSFERALGIGRRQDAGKSGRSLLAPFVLFNFIVLTWIPFRIESMENLSTLISKLLEIGSAPASLTYGYLAVAAIVLGGWAAQAIAERFEPYRYFLGLPIFAKVGAYGAATIAILVFSSGGQQPFIYFQF